MIMTNSTLNCDLTVLCGQKQSHFDAKRLYKILRSLTSDPRIIDRTGVLVITQLASYRSIKLHDLKCIIYRTLMQLNYRRLAGRYYENNF